MAQPYKALWLQSWGWKCKHKGDALIWTYSRHPNAVVQTEDKITYRGAQFARLRDAVIQAMKDHQGNVEREKAQ